MAPTTATSLRRELEARFDEVEISLARLRCRVLGSAEALIGHPKATGGMYSFQFDHDDPPQGVLTKASVPDD